MNFGKNQINFMRAMPLFSLAFCKDMHMGGGRVGGVAECFKNIYFKFYHLFMEYMMFML